VTDPTPYIYLPGTAREALLLYSEVFGGAAELHTFAEFRPTDGPAEAIAHGYLADGPVAVFAADATGDEPAFQAQGLMLSLLGTAVAATLRRWFTRVAETGKGVDDLQKRALGAVDGQVVGCYGVRWLIGFEDEPHRLIGLRMPRKPDATCCSLHAD
jgi:PhnB protein